jgi:riboflavin transporter FmnP
LIKLDSKKIALSAVFAALAVALNPFSIPAPFFPFISYQFWEIPIIVVFLLVGFREGIFVAAINAVILLTFSPQFVTVGGIIASFSMLLGIFLAFKLASSSIFPERTMWSKRFVFAFTIGGIVFRTIFMTVFNYAMLRYPIPFGLHLSQAYILAIMPPIALFNVTEPLYVVPLGFFIAEAASRGLKVNNEETIFKSTS